MLYNALKILIESGRTTNMKEKLALFCSTDAITMEEYAELVALLPKEEA